MEVKVSVPPAEAKKMNYYVEKGLDNVYYWFGSDNFGRDIWTRTWSGAKVSLDHCCGSCLIDMIIGMSYGLISGYFGGKVDMVMQRILEIANGIPRLVIVTLLLLVLKPGMLTDHFCTDADGVGRHEQDCKGRDVKAERAGVCFSIKNTWCGKFLYYIQRNPAKHYRTDHYTGNVLYTDCYFYRGILKFL